MGKDLEISIEDLRPGDFRKVAQVIGIEAALALSRAFGKMTIYIPGIDRVIEVRARDRHIVEEFEAGKWQSVWAAHRELARKYSLTPIWIRQILKRAREKRAK
ncbi:MAG: Mor transcription activator family protein [Syntrophorhabdales bacterium]|jgi:Mor family transcriptional regulator